MKKPSLLFGGIVSVLTLAMCLGSIANLAFAEGEGSGLGSPSIGNEVYCKVTATVNGTSVSLSIQATDQSGNVVPMPLGYSFNPQSTAVGGVFGGSMNTYLIAIDAMGNGNLSNILPGLYSVNGFLVGPNGEQIACKTTRFNIAAVSNSYIDLSLKQELVNSNGVSYKYRITVKNDGNALASNFTVKDYLPTNSSFSFSSDGGVYNNTNHTVTWFVADLPAGQSKSMTIVVNRKNSAILLNKSEACAYEELGEAQDPDSNACTMGPLGNPLEDDEYLFSVPALIN